MASATASRLPALILCPVKNGKLSLTETLLKLHLVARHHSNPQKQPHVPGLYPSSWLRIVGNQVTFWNVCGWRSCRGRGGDRGSQASADRWSARSAGTREGGGA